MNLFSNRSPIFAQIWLILFGYSIPLQAIDWLSNTTSATMTHEQDLSQNNMFHVQLIKILNSDIELLQPRILTQEHTVI